MDMRRRSTWETGAIFLLLPLLLLLLGAECEAAPQAPQTTLGISHLDKHRKLIEDHNKKHDLGHVSWRTKENEFSHIPYHEVLSKLTGHIETHLDNLTDICEYIPQGNSQIPPFLDYRKIGAVNKVRHQHGNPVKHQHGNPVRHQHGNGSCASCWAFSAISSIESKIFLHSGELVELSEQYLLDCSRDIGFPGNASWTGCDGGWKRGAIEYIEINGIALRETYPYTANKEGECNNNAKKTSYKFTGIQKVQHKNDTALLNALVHTGPIAVSIHITENFQHYHHGVLVDPDCKDNDITNHAMVLVGYGTTENGTKYWLLRNSWGENWGDQGYIKLSRETKNHCQISSRAYIPIVEACPSPFRSVGNLCLQVDHMSKNWTAAKNKCQSLKGRLVNLVNSANDTQNVKNKISGDASFWVGGKWKSNVLHWIDDDDDDSVIKKGSTGEPSSNDGSDGCVAIQKLDSKYKNLDCGKLLPFICEFEHKWYLHLDACITGDDNQEKSNAKNVEDCKKQCLGHRNSEEFICKSIQYHKVSQTCILSNKNTETEGFQVPCDKEGWIYTELFRPIENPG